MTMDDVDDDDDDENRKKKETKSVVLCFKSISCFALYKWVFVFMIFFFQFIHSSIESAYASSIFLFVIIVIV